MSSTASNVRSTAWHLSVSTATARSSATVWSQMADSSAARTAPCPRVPKAWSTTCEGGCRPGPKGSFPSFIPGKVQRHSAWDTDVGIQPAYSGVRRYRPLSLRQPAARELRLRAAIAERLHLGVTTVKMHIGNLMTKTGATNGIQLAVLGAAHH
ncbi:LuxR C-terminal-related transcriptional regulator [Nocardia sp. NPDC049526]|uniref:LuxR C-terminal-related transcriptional regulator n=1 Tax=Nocardia sp. NPDC049526 TaxID=3364316 RepID=UPI00378D9E09